MRRKPLVLTVRERLMPSLLSPLMGSPSWGEGRSLLRMEVW